MRKNLWIGALAAATASLAATPAGAIGITLGQLDGLQNALIGIDYHEPTNTNVFSLNYPSGTPNNFARIDAAGTIFAFSSVSGLTEEVKIATQRTQPGQQFPTGTLFTGNGVDGQIARINPGGTIFANPWVNLPGASNGLMRGSLYVDRTGVYGGDVIAVTTLGEVWRINGAGTPTFIADVNTHLEGVITVPNVPAIYGPLAGKIIAGNETTGRLLVFDGTGVVGHLGPAGGPGTNLGALGVTVEDIDLIEAGSSFFGNNFNSAASRILFAPASDFASIVGDILLTQEGHSSAVTGLYQLHWNPGSGQFEVTQLTLNAGSAAPGSQWEHVTFSPAPTSAPEPGTLALLGLGLAGLAVLARRGSKA